MFELNSKSHHLIMSFSPNCANFQSPLCITFDLNLLLLRKSDPRSAGRKFSLSAWLIITLNTAAAGGYQSFSEKKKQHITVTLMWVFLLPDSNVSVHTLLGWVSFLTPGLLKPVKIPSCCFRNVLYMAADEIMGTRFLHSGQARFCFVFCFFIICRCMVFLWQQLMLLK